MTLVVVLLSVRKSRDRNSAFVAFLASLRYTNNNFLS